MHGKGCDCCDGAKFIKTLEKEKKRIATTLVKLLEK